SRITELTSLVQKRFKFPETSVELYTERVNNRGLCAIARAGSLRYKLLGGLPVRRACYGVLRFVMENGAKGCEVTSLSLLTPKSAYLKPVTLFSQTLLAVEKKSKTLNRIKPGLMIQVYSRTRSAQSTHLVIFSSANLAGSQHNALKTISQNTLDIPFSCHQ
ncbi:40S ribosomal protein S3-1-like protein, partial [Tanacetum coccineum]